MNVLILSCGTRNKIVQYFCRALDGKGTVVTADCSDIAPALYEGDRYYTVPRVGSDEYLEAVLDICKKEKIGGVLSLIDPELSVLAKNSGRFSAIGTTVVGSDYEECERCFDKFQMYNWLSEHNYLCARSYIDKNLFYSDADSRIANGTVFIKPVRGSASVGISKTNDRFLIDYLFEHNDGMMIQEYLGGQEIGADVYVDMISGEVVSIFTKKKIAMRAGETDKAVSFKDPELFSLIERFTLESGFRGQIDIDIFETDGRYYISEVNPRFGGGFPHAYECGLDHMKMIINNLEGRANRKNIGAYESGVYMMKYNEIMVHKPL